MIANRHVKFISLDTHPARDSLVVTYEIFVSISDPEAGGRELIRRSRRDQFQIGLQSIKQLVAGGEADNRTDDGQRSQGLAAKLRDIGAQIVEKCPLLAADRRNIEDIQLHLLYLINRKRQGQLDAKSGDNYRPPSSVSLRRLNSNRAEHSARAAARSSQLHSAAGFRPSSSASVRQTPTASTADAHNVYLEFRARELAGRAASLTEELDAFLEQLDHRLCILEQQLPLGSDPLAGSDQLNAQLESLYGDQAEQLRAVGSIRSQLTSGGTSASENQRRLLAQLCSNRLLLSALLRVLRDSIDLESPADSYLSEAVLHCLLVLTKFLVFSSRLGGDELLAKQQAIDERLDLDKLVVDLLHRQVEQSVENNREQPLVDRFYRVGSLLLILLNLIVCIEPSAPNTTLERQRRLLKQPDFLDTLSKLLGLVAKQLPADLRKQVLRKRHERLAWIASQLVATLWQLSAHQELLVQLRPKSAALADSLVSLLDTLQLNRSRAGNKTDDLLAVRDSELLDEMYAIEINALKLVNNLLFDCKVRQKFLKKQLTLKCVLRNLVLFLAQDSATSPSATGCKSLLAFDRSSVLISPLKCLHVLSCHDSIKAELFKSKIIIKCLFEYLLSVAADARSALMTRGGDDAGQPIGEITFGENNVVQLEANESGHLIVGVWLNLSACKEAPFYTPTGRGFHEQSIVDYVDATIENVESFAAASVGRSRSTSALKIYVHLKLLRNFSQFLAFDDTWAVLNIEHVLTWIRSLARSVGALLGATDPTELQLVNELAVECLACLANLIDSSASAARDEFDKQRPDEWSFEAVAVLEQLPLAKAFEGGENDHLLLVSLNYLGVVAKNCEICSRRSLWTGPFGARLLEVAAFVLETKSSSDAELIVCCLFTLSQLMSHSHFVANFMIDYSPGVETNHELESTTTTTTIEQRRVARLVDRLARLTAHSELAASKLANSILNQLKQLEEMTNLGESSTICKLRFDCFNCKWLGAIRSNRNEQSTSLDLEDPDDEHVASQLDNQWALARAPTAGSGASDEDRDGRNDFNQLRTIIDEEADEDEVPRASARVAQPKWSANKDSREEDSFTGDDDDEDDDDFEESVTSAGPDLNVIDANSMIKHLTDRRQPEWLRR